jgi:signal transduction histidine kinase
MAQEHIQPTAQIGVDITRFWRSLLIVFCVAIVWSTVRTLPHPIWPTGAGTLLVAAVYVILWPLTVPRRQFGMVLAIGILSVALQILDPQGPANVAAIAAIALAARLALVPAGIIAAITACGMFAALLATTHQSATSVLSSQATSYFFTFVASASIGRLRREQRRTAALLQEVLAGRDAQVHAAKLDERAHLAREMHDVLAHTLSALSIQLEGARMLAEQRGSDPAMVSTLDRVTRLAKEGLLEARRAVGSLRGDSLPGPDLLPVLLETFERDTSIAATLRIEGKIRDLPSEARLAIYRTAQEALTNIRKHAEATAVSITLRYTADDVELRVENQGRTRTDAMPGGGYGLVGMRERAELLGGRLDAGPTIDGFTVDLWIPL